SPSRHEGAAPQRRRLCRPPGRGRGGRVLAPPVRQAQLAADRRDAALDRGNCRRRHGPDDGTAPSGGVVAPMWLVADPLVLASRSAIRRAVLEAAGIPAEAFPADLDERAIEAGAGTADPGAVAALLARSKAEAAAALRPGRIVLGADQTLALGQARFSKPKDRTGARVQLLALRGQTHELHSAVAVVRDQKVLYQG